MGLLYNAFRRVFFGSAKKAMAPQSNDINMQNQQFFISQSEKLAALLDVVVDESSTATDPNALVDYLELTKILTDLLDEARMYSLLSIDQIKLRAQEVQVFVDKIQSVEEAVGDWSARTKGSISSSRKRPRSANSSDESLSEWKRRKDSGRAHNIVQAGYFINPIVDISVSVEEAPTQWWTEPFYD